jgi:Uma2 family endonuclease
MAIVPDTATTVVRASHVPGPRQGQWTYEDYAALPQVEGFRYEVIDGVLYMSPAPSTGHERIVMTIGARLVQALEDTGLGRVFASPNIAYGPSTLRPDAVVVLEANRGVVADALIVGPPDLVVEIASPSTAAYDREPVEGKRGAYARMGVPEYWLVDPEARSVEVLALEGGAYTALGVFRGDERLLSRALPALDVRARQLFPRDEM